MIEKIEYNNELMAVIVRNDHNEAGVQFFTPDDFSQQLRIHETSLRKDHRTPYPQFCDP